MQCACAHPCTVPGWSEYLGISGYSDRGGSSVHVPIHVLSRDRQGISGSRDTLTGGGACAHPCTIPGWSEYLGISGYSDRGVHAVCMCPSVYCPGMVRVSWDLGIYSDRGGEQCACTHPCTVPRWSGYLGISGYSDRGVHAVCMCPSMYCPGMIRVSWNLGIL